MSKVSNGHLRVDCVKRINMVNTTGPSMEPTSVPMENKTLFINKTEMKNTIFTVWIFFQNFYRITCGIWEMDQRINKM